MSRRTPLAAILVAMLAALGLLVAAGCGSDEPEEAVEAVESVATSVATEATAPDEEPGTTAGGAAGAETVVIPAAEQGLAYQVEEATAPAGTITLSMPNPSPLPHNIAVEEPQPEEGETVQMGGTSEITLDFPVGDYEYFCTVPGHREAGMEGLLTVQ